MVRKSALLLMLGVILPLGCRSRERTYHANDRVNVDVPFVNVHVGEEGGVKVRAPFTNVETPRYRQNAPVYQQPAPTSTAPPANYVPVRPTYPAATYQ